jgi:ribosomal protein S18 acetylase RimI-like enzyme
LTPLEWLRIVEIFTEDKELYKYCDPDFIIDGDKVSVKIVKRIQDTLKTYPDSYCVINERDNYFFVFLYAHGEWILYSFGVHPDFRTHENLQRFWDHLTREHDEFICYLYDNNTRAIDWLKRMGMIPESKVVESAKKIAVKLRLTKEEISLI